MARLAMCANRINERNPDCSLLDAGYRAMDLIPADGMIHCDIQKPLPMKGKSYDVVTVLDVWITSITLTGLSENYAGWFGKQFLFPSRISITLDFSGISFAVGNFRGNMRSFQNRFWMGIGGVLSLGSHEIC